MLSPLIKGHNFSTQFMIDGRRDKEKKQALSLIT